MTRHRDQGFGDPQSRKAKRRTSVLRAGPVPWPCVSSRQIGNATARQQGIGLGPAQPAASGFHFADVVAGGVVGVGTNRGLHLRPSLGFLGIMGSIGHLHLPSRGPCASTRAAEAPPSDAAAMRHPGADSVPESVQRGSGIFVSLCNFMLLKEKVRPRAGKKARIQEFLSNRWELEADDHGVSGAHSDRRRRPADP